MRARSWEWMVVVAVLCSGTASAYESLHDVVSDVGDYWGVGAVEDSLTEPLSIAAPWDEVSVATGDVTPAQMLTPQRNLGPRVAQRTTTPSTRKSSTRLASVPFMIGDTGAGTCMSFRGLFDADLSHPTFGCSRLNVSENNSPLPTDRLFFSYRHFHNATPWRFYQFRKDHDLDRYTLGGEKTFADGAMSFEVRMPLENRLSSQLYTYDVFDPPYFLNPAQFPPGFDPFGGGTRVELGNVSFLLKALLAERDDFALSAGLGVTLPTAQDIEWLVTTDDRLVFPSMPGVYAESSILLDIYVSNETIYLNPFLAWLWTPGPRFFHQGFWQVEVAANPTSVTMAGNGLTDFYDGGGFLGTLDWYVSDLNVPSRRVDLSLQSLMRLNLGWGYHFIDDPCRDVLQRLTGLFEVHYTSTLNDAPISLIPVGITGSVGTPSAQTISVGNMAGRVDILNMVAGLSAKMNSWIFTNGVTVPIKSRPCDRGFDFEYNFQAQRVF